MALDDLINDPRWLNSKASSKSLYMTAKALGLGSGEAWQQFKKKYSGATNRELVQLQGLLPSQERAASQEQTKPIAELRKKERALNLFQKATDMLQHHIGLTKAKPMDEKRGAAPQKPRKPITDIRKKENAVKQFLRVADLLRRHIELIKTNPDAQTVYLNGVPISTDSPYFRMIRFKDQGQEITYHVTSTRGAVFETKELYIIPWTAPITAIASTQPGKEVTHPFPDDLRRPVYRALQIIEKDDFEISHGVLNKYSHASKDGEFSTDGISAEGLENEDVVLSQTITKEMPTAAPRADDSHTLQTIVQKIRAEQDAIIRAPAEQVILVKGAPGTGKTTIAMHRIPVLLDREERDFDESRVLIFVFNASLSEYIRNMLTGLQLKEVQVTYQFKWVSEIAKLLNLRATFDDDPKRLKTGSFHIGSIALFLKAWSARVVSELRTEIASWDMKDDWRNGLLSFVNLDNQVLTLSKLDAWAEATTTLSADYTGKYPWKAVSEKESARVISRTRTLFEEVREQILKPQIILRQYYRSEEFHNAARDYLERSGVEAVDETLAIFLDEIGEALNDENNRSLNQADVVLAALIVRHLDRDRLRLAYHHIVVDEAQDISATIFYLLHSLLRENKKSMTIVGDAGQTLYGAGLSSWKDFGFKTESYELKLSHRCPYHIMRFASHVMNRDVAPLDVSEAEKVVNIGYKPQVRLFKAAENEAKFVAEEISQLRKNDPGASILVVASQQKYLTDVRKAIEENSVKCHLAKGNDFIFGSVVTLTNMHQVKGLEFDYVFIVHLNRLYEADWMGKKQDFLFYVSVTRALKKLYITANTLPKVFERIPRELYQFDTF